MSRGGYAIGPPSLPVSLLHYEPDVSDIETPEDRAPVCIGCGYWAPTCGAYCEGCLEDEGG